MTWHDIIEDVIHLFMAIISKLINALRIHTHTHEIRKCFCAILHNVHPTLFNEIMAQQGLAYASWCMGQNLSID